MSRKTAPAILLLCIIGLLVVMMASAEDKTIPSGPFLGLSCEDCHTCASPTKSNPCLRACPRPRIAYKKMASDTIVLDQLENLYVPVFFAHKAHGHMGEAEEDCGTCHHHTPAGYGYPPCRECHSIRPSAESLVEPNLKGAYHQRCMACHMVWSHDKECNVCHVRKGEEAVAGELAERHYPAVQRPDRQLWETEEYEEGTKVTFFHKNHVELFGIACTECHRGESCRNCHDKGEPHFKFVRDADAFHEMCNQCHAKRSCDWCHRTEEIAAFTHDQTGWPLNRYHRPLRCQQCHKTTGKFSGLSRKCDVCHKSWGPETFNHGKVTGVALDDIHAEMDCGDCHENRDFSRKPTCEACHDDGRSYPTSRPGP